jgi:hypothetical protein
MGSSQKKKKNIHICCHDRIKTCDTKHHSFTQKVKCNTDYKTQRRDEDSAVSFKAYIMNGEIKTQFVITAARAFSC